jgi:hypothetical protein
LDTSPNGGYVPPTRLSTIADIFRRMTAPVEVNGRGPFHLVVDTGANQSVISQELAQQLELPLGAPRPLHGVAGVEIAPTVTAAEVRVGQRLVSQADFSVLPQASIGGLGMLGLDLLANQRLTLDFQGRRLVIEESRKLTADPGDISVVARERDGQLTLVEAKMFGIPVLSFLDSGAQSSIGNLALREYANKEGLAQVWTTVPILSATGQTILGRRAVLPMFRLGKMKLENLPLVFSDLHIFRLWNMEDQPAVLLGIDVLSQFASVCLDFGRSEVRFRMPELS